MGTVLIVQRRLTHYRVPFFIALRSELTKRGCALLLAYGNSTVEELSKHDNGELSWATKLPTRYFVGERFCWQPFRHLLAEVDLAVVDQENKLLFNHWLIFVPRRFKLGFWGHGANLQSANPLGFKERFKKWTTRRVDWWFAYTQTSADLVQATGFPANRITVLNNSIDTSEMQLHRQAVTAEEIRALRQTLGFALGQVGIFVGSLHEDKRLNFLFTSAKAIRDKVPDFSLLIMGDGPERDKVKAWCAEHSWARWVGARFGKEKVTYLAVAQLMLNPGLVGLGILDSFVCGVPMLTTDCGLHSPEIVYLENGVNGIMTENNLIAYVESCVRLLRDPVSLANLRTGCCHSASEYTVENMAQRFADGVEGALTKERHDFKRSVR